MFRKSWLGFCRFPGKFYFAPLLFIETVVMEWRGRFRRIIFPFIRSNGRRLLLPLLRTITAILPSGFLNEDVSRLSSYVLLPMRRAPRFTYLLKCPTA